MERPPRYAVIVILALLIPVGLSPTWDGSSLTQEFNPAKDVVAADDGESMVRFSVQEDEAIMNTSADSNYDGIESYGGLWVGLSSGADLTRSFVKYNLQAVPSDVKFESAAVHLFMSGPAAASEDIPIGVYLADDNWTEQTITWNNQPHASDVPASVIDSPESPNTFIVGNWYSWDITEYIFPTITGDKILSLLLKSTNELGPASTFSAFAEKDHEDYYVNASYVTITYSIPEVQDITVEGIADSPLLEYIQNPNPAIEWTFLDSDTGDAQRNYEAEFFNNSGYDNPPLWDDNSHNHFLTCERGEETGTAPWGISNEMRFQYKFSSSIINQSGILDRIAFGVNTTSQVVTLDNLVVSLACTNVTGNLGTDFDANFGMCEPVIVKYSESYIAPVINGQLIIDIANLFILAQDLDFIIEVRYMNSSATGLLSLYDSTPGSGSVAYTWGPAAYQNDQAFFTDPFCYNIDLHFLTTETKSWNETSASDIPFGLASNSSGTVQFKYNSSQLEGPGYIGRLFIHVNNTMHDVVLENISVVLAEIALKGQLSNDLLANLNGAEGVEVLVQDEYRLDNFGGLLALDLGGTFYYSGQNDLLVQISWDQKEGQLPTFVSNVGGYTAWNYYDNSTHNSNSTWVPEIGVEYLRPLTHTTYDGLALVEGQTTYIRLRVMDLAGSWSEWEYLSFKYQPLTEGPLYEGPLVTPQQAILGQSVEVRINVTHAIGVSQVLIELDGSNRTMVQDGSSYNYTWTPASEGTHSFTIYMQSVIGTWSTVGGSVLVQQSTTATGNGNELLIVLIAAGVGAAAVAGIALVRRRRPAAT
jgi:hypothetical protein